ncbi:MAG: hypothetical protein NDI68_07170, partial [Arenimonas sp.]|nr:hypothetical protein [Arenimonas sp.]
RELREAVQDTTRDLREAGQAIGGAVREAEAQAQGTPPAGPPAPEAPETPAAPAPRQDPPAP